MKHLYHKLMGHTLKPLYRKSNNVPDNYLLAPVYIGFSNPRKFYYLGYRRTGLYCVNCKKKILFNKKYQLT